MLNAQSVRFDVQRGPMSYFRHDKRQDVTALASQTEHATQDSHACSSLIMAYLIAGRAAFTKGLSLHQQSSPRKESTMLCIVALLGRKSSCSPVRLSLATHVGMCIPIDSGAVHCTSYLVHVSMYTVTLPYRSGSLRQWYMSNVYSVCL